MAEIKSFRDLNVYQLGREQAKQILIVSRNFPKEETYSLTSQIRRSSRAVNALVAESWARRRYEAAFINKLNEALGEAMETQSWLDHALESEYITLEQHRELDQSWQRIGAMLNKMIQRADTFCQSASK
jgi:four helix bundle protein